MKCELCDIVVVSNFEYPNKKESSLHYFVIMGVNQDEFEVVDLDYLGLIVSSQKEKETYPFNESIKADDTNNLQTDSHVKCDHVFEIKPDNIIMKLGTITTEQYLKFMELYKKSVG